jgi:hypothetical protein
MLVYFLFANFNSNTSRLAPQYDTTMGGIGHVTLKDRWLLRVSTSSNGSVVSYET